MKLFRWINGGVITRLVVFAVAGMAVIAVVSAGTASAAPSMLCGGDAAYQVEVSGSSAAAGPPDVRCSGTFSGTAHDLTVPSNVPNCLLMGATITHDVIVQENGFLLAEGTTIGHDLIAYKPSTVNTGIANDVEGPVEVGHDIVISGPLTDQFGNHSCCPGIADTTIGRDLRISDLLVDFEMGIHNDDVGRDLVVTGNSTGICCGFGPIDVGNNSVGRDLVVSGNTTAGGDFGWISVYENNVARDATCANNSPPESKKSPGQLDFLGRSVGPNTVGRNDSCD